MHTVQEVIDYLQQQIPLELAAEWDNVGLLLGAGSGSLQKIMTCLTVTPESAAEAIEAGAGLVVTHHPILFRPVQRLTEATPEGRMLLGLARAGAALWSPHTAFDNARGGINDLLAERLGLVDIVPLRCREAAGQVKIVVFVPDNDLGRVADALFAAGAGIIGQYRECSFRLPGTGTFFPTESTNPTVGQRGRREEVSEWRLEVVCAVGRLEAALTAMRRAHSYEEPAFDVYPLRPGAGKDGEGRIGRLPRPGTLAELGQVVKSVLPARQVQLVGDPTRSVERVALACGAAGEFLADAVRARADVFLTGEARFHDYLSAQAQGIGLLLPGHYATERPGIEALATRLQQQFPALKVWASQREQDPGQWI
jgi:dinuclear metal center YbgI/SA1388 family protein